MSTYENLDPVAFGRVFSPKMTGGYLKALLRNAQSHPAETAQVFVSYDFIGRMNNLCATNKEIGKRAARLIADGGGITALLRRRTVAKIFADCLEIMKWANVSNNLAYQLLFEATSACTYAEDLQPRDLVPISDQMIQGLSRALDAGYFGAFLIVDLKTMVVKSRAAANIVACSIAVDRKRTDETRTPAYAWQYTITSDPAAKLKPNMCYANFTDVVDKFTMIVDAGYPDIALGVHDFAHIADKLGTKAPDFAREFTEMQGRISHRAGARKKIMTLLCDIANSANSLVKELRESDQCVHIDQLVDANRIAYNGWKAVDSKILKEEAIVKKCMHRMITAKALVGLPITVFIYKASALMSIGCPQLVIFEILEISDPTIFAAIPIHKLFYMEVAIRDAHKNAHSWWHAPPVADRKRKWITAPEELFN